MLSPRLWRPPGSEPFVLAPDWNRRPLPGPPKPAGATKSIALSIDGGHVRAARQYQGRSFEVLLAQVSNDEGKQVVFSTVPAEANSQTRQLRGVLRGLSATPATPVTILSDGADGPRSLGEAASPGPTHHVLDWFHLAMRVQHVAQAAMVGPMRRRRIVRPVLASPRRSNGSVGVSGMVRSSVRWISSPKPSLLWMPQRTIRSRGPPPGARWRAFWAIWRHTCPDNRIRVQQAAQLFGVELFTQRRRAQQVAEHHGELAAFATREWAVTAGLAVGGRSTADGVGAGAGIASAAMASSSLRRWAMSRSPRRQRRAPCSGFCIAEWGRSSKCAGRRVVLT